MEEELIKDIKRHILEKLDVKSNEIIAELSDDYFKRMYNYKKELINEIIDNLTIKYSQDDINNLYKLQIEIINTYKRGE